jgi:hypothetical protein
VYLNDLTFIKQCPGAENKNSLQRMYVNAVFDVFRAMLLRFMSSGIVDTTSTLKMETLSSETPVTSQHSLTSQKN